MDSIVFAFAVQRCELVIASLVDALLLLVHKEDGAVLQFCFR